MTAAERLAILADFAHGRRGTRDTIAMLGMEDYADLLIALAQADLPRPPETPEREAERARARDLLLPRLLDAA